MAELILSRTHADGSLTYQFPDVEPMGVKRGKVLSVQPDGSEEVRPAGTAGAYEKFRDGGDVAIFEPIAGVVYGKRLVD
jgi:hypothetical protein